MSIQYLLRRIGAGLAAAAFTAARADEPLDLDRALRLAEQRSGQVVAHEAAARAARELAIAAGQRPDPTVKVGINNLPIDGPDRFSVTRDFMTMRSVGVTQELTRGDKLGARAARFEREAEAAQAAGALTLANLRRDTALAWLERHYQQRMLDELRALRAEAGVQVEAATAAYAGGRGAPADAFAARSAVALIDDRIRQAERQVATATTRLARWVGDAAGQQPLGAPPPLADVHLDASHLDSVLAQHPQIALLARQEDAARADAEIARSSQRPDWSVELMFSQRGPAYSNMVSVNLSVPLQIDRANRQDRELAARFAVVEQLRAQRDEATREHLAEARTWLQQWHGDRERLAHYGTTLIPLAAQRTAAALAAYRGGGGLLAAVLEARRAEIDTRIERLRIEMEAAAQWARLEYLVAPVKER